MCQKFATILRHLWPSQPGNCKEPTCSLRKLEERPGTGFFCPLADRIKGRTQIPHFIIQCHQVSSPFTYFYLCTISIQSRESQLWEYWFTVQTLSLKYMYFFLTKIEHLNASVHSSLFLGCPCISIRIELTYSGHLPCATWCYTFACSFSYFNYSLNLGSRHFSITSPVPSIT